jgi:hypothetical protein
VTDDDLKTLLEFHKTGRKDGTFELGIQFALERMLIDPDFLFRAERTPPGVKAGAPYKLSDLELASRLSFFLWSSVPDDQFWMKRLAESSRIRRFSRRRCVG